ncbi:MAG: Glu-tRNA(Gln) amidotransferase subunit GatE [Candidatus Hadarchaeales archaeon]
MIIDYGAIGLKVGLEIHQELATKKLFCACPTLLSDKTPEGTVIRRLRPTQSELGEFDRAALAEAIKGKGFKYQMDSDTTCLVELDEEPPHSVRDDVIDAALEISLLLNAKPVDEVHVMRKVVIDGSNTSGFQRTMLIAMDGWIEVEGKRYKITTVCLEEDAARKVGETEEYIEYRLDRLGIPLVEIATAAEFSDPETPAKVAFYIGQLCRMTSKVKWGLGATRQDINISISGGARQEIKGIQELSLIPKVIEFEAARQLGLLKLKDELNRRGVKENPCEIRKVTHIFENTACRMIKKAIESGADVFAVKLAGFAGLLGMELCPGRRFGMELADRARVFGKVGGIFHTDELPNYGISDEEVSKLKNEMGASENDVVVLTVAKPKDAENALRAVVERANMAIVGVPEETRRALSDGTTEFMRPLPGAARMYPETDIPPIPIDKRRIAKIKKKLPERPEQKIERFMKSYKLSRELAEQMVFYGDFRLFEDLLKRTKADPTLVATLLTQTLTSLRREGVQVERIRVEDIAEILILVRKKKIAKEGISEILREISSGISVKEAIDKLNLWSISERDLCEFVRKVVCEKKSFILERREAALQPLMGILMQSLRGRVDGETVHKLLEKEIRKVLREEAK